MAKNRYIGEYPVIGIRPIIDGRRGPMPLSWSLLLLPLFGFYLVLFPGAVGYALSFSLVCSDDTFSFSVLACVLDASSDDAVSFA